ncbi:AMP-dependent synthetase/ligase [Desulfofustis glycolicus]|uniref:Long-chain acyl-CoA synthetase n=1 Tax=Desulfofustis glycolicus DSM 9705 TaxID=1121409 RepID=A0A1M5YA94_9BACT|nr:long-chain fatty acid--CoA ligase [Desulfofustis glycolicus]MCB2218472.1 long-chain fatty acid--CoA ligase [Desulfobulbaceae bacterium]SHI09000.1 long-chain acyl-CoA synthetase [Desulfofustis glycolicus DSM 9705]
MDFLSHQSIPAILKVNARQFAKKTAVSFKKQGVFLSLTYEEFYERVLMLARGLVKVGLKPEDPVCIFSENRLGWAISDFGIQSARGIPVPIYATNTGKQAAYIINHCGAKIVFVSTKAQYEKLLEVRDEIPGVELVISYERFIGDRSFPVYTQYQLSEAGEPLLPEEKVEIERMIDQIAQQDLITIIYTSGTTGVPKGVMLTQYNIMSNAQIGLKQLGALKDQETFLSFLPLSHVLERTAGYYATLLSGQHVAFAEDVKKVMENMVEVQPTWMVSVPRLFEKIYSRVHENAHQLSPLRRSIFHRALQVGRDYANKKYVDGQVDGLLAMQYRLYDRLVFRKIRDRFGGRLRGFICGGAPLDRTINEFMWAIGLPVFNGYGLTETSPALTLCNLGAVRFDSVGKPLAMTELKLAEDGELLVKGPQVMRGYYKSEEKTAEIFSDGWLKTGDIARIDENGFVYIVDRKKEIIVTAGGKNIAPQPIENELKLDKYISQAIVFGDRKPYLVALLNPNLERLIDWSREEELDYLDTDELVKSNRVRALYTERIAELNKNLPPYATIKEFVLIPGEFTIEGGELTPTLKLKRKEIYNKYKEMVDQMYMKKGNGLVFQTTSTDGEKK